MIKILYLKTGCTNKIKAKFIRNTQYLNVINNSLEMLIFTKDAPNCIVDLGSVGYYNVKQCYTASVVHCSEYKPLQVL